MEAYNHKKVEKKWQGVWQKKGLYTSKDSVSGKENFYLLVEFPYPSGNLHVGHWYAFALPDIAARFQRMQGKNVLFPIGFDAFGLPAENAAIKNKLNPRTWTEKNIKYMKTQIKSMGASYDWSREVQTIDPGYYKWTQWIFLQFFKNNLVYRKKTAVNWCPKDKTVLANEQVVDGKCERCDSQVEQKLMLQWNIQITKYADRLIDDLAPLDWPEQIKESQRNWIGRSEGAEIDFPLSGVDDANHIVILHGRNGSPDSHVFPWLKEQFTKRGYTVELPRLPHTEEPNDDEQADFVQQNCRLDEKTIIFGQSFGGIVAMRLLERGVKVHRVVLATTPFSGTFMDGRVRASVTEACRKGFDFEKIKQNARAFIVMPDTTDKIVPIEDSEMWSQNLGGMYIKGTGSVPHFSGAREPDLVLATVPTIRVFTTRADTLYGVTFLALAPEHPWVQLAIDEKHNVLSNKSEVRDYVEKAKRKSELERLTDQKDKTGVELKGVKAINPTTGKEISLWVADYVLATYGSGAVMGVPAHDERDFEFAKKFNVPVTYVVAPKFVDQTNPPRQDKKVVYRKTVLGIVRDPKNGKYLCLKWKKQPWLTFVVGGVEGDEDYVDAAIREIEEETGYTNLKTVGQIGGPVRVDFFAAHKDENREALQCAVLFEVEEHSEVKAISAEEADKHEIVWLKESELTRPPMTHAELSVVLENIRKGARAYGGAGVLINSAEFDGKSTAEAKLLISEKYGRVKTTYKLRDWIVSRQRYWGVPIPIIHCAECGSVPVPEKDLPVKLPVVKDYLPEGSGKSPLAKAKSWVKVKCPKCKKWAERETDTLDTFVDSSWYFQRYTDPKNKTKFADAKKLSSWLPVDLYSGGAEHTTMHLLYSRFWHKAMHDLGLVKDSEPYKRRMNRSIILGPDGQKMSKSRGNVIDPDEVVARLGADTVRLYLAFIGPYSEVSSYPWNPDGVVGVRRFLERVWKSQEYVVKKDVEALDAILHKTIKKVGDDVPALKFNTAISQMMICLNEIESQKSIGKNQWKSFLQLLAPFAPHMTEELWSKMKAAGSVHLQKWPKFDSLKVVEKSITIAVQVNGKTRAEVNIDATASKSAIEEAARVAVSSRIEGKKILRTILVPGRLVNFVVEEQPTVL